MATLKLGLVTMTLLLACNGNGVELGVYDGEGGSDSGAAGDDGDSGGGISGATFGGAGGATPAGGASAGSPPAGGASAGSSTAGGAPGDSDGGGVAGKTGFTPPATFDSLELVVNLGYRPFGAAPTPEDAECDTTSVVDTFSLDTKSRVFSWDTCDELNRFQNRLSAGSRVISVAELETVERGVSALGPPNPRCHADAWPIVVDLTTASGTLRIQDDLVVCDAPLDGRTPVGNVDPLVEALLNLYANPPPPNFEKITVVSSGGGPLPPEDPSVECQPGYYEDTFSADFAKSELAWDFCRGGVTDEVRSGTRTLSEEELATITMAARALENGADGECAPDKSVIVADVVTDSGTRHYIDQEYSCNPTLDGRIFIRNVDDLLGALSRLVPRD